MLPAANPSSDPTTEKPLRAKRWIPLSLRIFAAILVILVVMWVVCIGIPGYWQHVAICEIERVNGRVEWTRQRGPQWLRTALGRHLCMSLLDDILGVSLDDSDATDSTLVHLKRLSHLDYLGLNRTAVTDAGLVHLAGLTRLRSLSLGGTHVGDAGLAQLKGLTGLECLNLSRTEVTDGGMPSIHALIHLRRLMLKKTQVKGPGLEHLQGLPLWQLDAIGSAIDDDGLTCVARLSGLTHMFLDETEVTDAGILKLAALSSLEYITVHGTAVTGSGIADLQQALPALEITKEWRH